MFQNSIGNKYQQFRFSMFWEIDLQCILKGLHVLYGSLLWFYCLCLQSLFYLPFAIANALTALLNDGYVWLMCCTRILATHTHTRTFLTSYAIFMWWQSSFSWWVVGCSWLLCIHRYIACCMHELMYTMDMHLNLPVNIFIHHSSVQFLSTSYFLSLYSVGLYLHFATSVIHEITTALGIYCFR